MEIAGGKVVMATGDGSDGEGRSLSWKHTD